VLFLRLGYFGEAIVMEEVNETIHAYSWGIPVYVAFLDILGFRSAMEHQAESSDLSSTKLSSGDLTFSLWKNCLPQRSKLTHSPRLNFVQMSDSLVVYGDEFKPVLQLVCGIYGSALVWGVPIRGGFGYGVLNHAEESTRPGTVLSFYGEGLNDAYVTEKSGQGLGMRLLLSNNLLKHSNIENEKLIKIGNDLTEYPWWRECGVNKDHFAERVNLWWTKKTVNKWFKGAQRDDTKVVFEKALLELKGMCVSEID